jgi:L-asparaginase II
MLVTAAHLGLPLDDYTRPDHPIQLRVRETIASLASVDPREVAVASDGCSVPTFAMTLEQMALAFSRLVDPSTLRPSLRQACGRIMQAMWAHPELLSGAPGDTQDITSALVAQKRGVLVAKSGAEALYTVALAPGVLGSAGVGIAVRAEDGGNVHRSCYLATVETLRQLGALSVDDIGFLEPFLGRTVRNVHGQAVGHVEPSFTLEVVD